jgi:hypothetical protein
VALLEDLRKLDDAARPDAGPDLAGLRARLGATRRHVTEHFRFEEQNGYMDVVRAREPRLERVVQHLADEHRQLAQSLEALVAEAREAARLDDSLRGRVRAWVEKLRGHEARENELAQTTFNLDLTAED